MLMCGGTVKQHFLFSGKKGIFDTMEKEYIEGQIFDKIDFTQQRLKKGEYEQCTFSGCDFSKADMASISFSECVFTGCNMSMAKLGKTAFRAVQFRDCKMLGLHFEDCNPFGLAVNFESCILDHSSFYQVQVKKTVFKHTRLVEVDFTDCDLSGASFDGCTLAGAKFENTNLERADLRGAADYSINPELNKLKKAKFSMPAVMRLLDKYDIEIEM